MANKCLSLALHGGAGAIPDRSHEAEIAFMGDLAERMRDRLRAGAAALDVAVECVQALEASGLFVAGLAASSSTPA